MKGLFIMDKEDVSSYSIRINKSDVANASIEYR